MQVKCGQLFDLSFRHIRHLSILQLMEALNVSSTEAFNRSLFANPSVFVPFLIHKWMIARVAVYLAFKRILLIFIVINMTPWVQLLVATLAYTFNSFAVCTFQAISVRAITALHWVVQQVIADWARQMFYDVRVECAFREVLLPKLFWRKFDIREYLHPFVFSFGRLVLPCWIYIGSN